MRIFLSKNESIRRLKAGVVLRKLGRMIYERREARYEMEEIRKERVTVEVVDVDMEKVDTPKEEDTTQPDTPGGELESSMFSEAETESSVER